MANFDQALEDLTWDEVATAATIGYLTGGVILTVGLDRKGHSQVCHVLRCPAGLVAWVVFSLHLWVPWLDPFRQVPRLARVVGRRISPGGSHVQHR